MALRSLDNTMPITQERPKKQIKIPTILSKNEKQLPDFGVNDENKPPFSQPPATTEASVEYILSENLKEIKDPHVKIQGLVGGLESKDWLKVCESLNDVRRFALFHSDQLFPLLEKKVVLVMVKAMKNPRSALCKTAIMASADLFKAFGGKLFEFTSEALDQLVLQLLLKAVQDKKFVCDEAVRALKDMVESMSSLPMLHTLVAYVKHSNQKVRAKAANTISHCVSKMDLEGMKEFGLFPLLQIAANLLNDKLPEAREAARSIIVTLYNATTKDEEDKEESWQSLCESTLPAIHAHAMLKLVSSS